MKNIIILFFLIAEHAQAFDIGDRLMDSYVNGWNGVVKKSRSPFDPTTIVDINITERVEDNSNLSKFYNSLEYNTSLLNSYNSLEDNASAKSKKSELIKKVALGINNNGDTTTHVDIYRGVLGNRNLPFYIKSALTQDRQSTAKEITKDLFLDYQGGVLNTRVDLQDWVIKSYKRTADKKKLTTGDAIGFSFQVGAKLDEISKEVNGVEEKKNIFIPYVGLLAQADFGLYNQKETNTPEGTVQIGAYVSYQYLSSNILNEIGGAERNDGSVGIYANLVITEEFSINASYSTVISHFNAYERTLISLSLYPSK